MGSSLERTGLIFLTGRVKKNYLDFYLSQCFACFTVSLTG
jgi:hypothetical protein